MTANTENLRARYAIKRKSVKNTKKRTRQTHYQATLIRTTKVSINIRYKNMRGGIKGFVKKDIGDLINANIDVHSIKLIAEFPVDGVKFI